jgi:tricorn protease
VGNISSPQFSPDGKWISYTKPEAMMRTHVYVRPLSGGEERRIESEDFILSGGAKWTPDGRKLLVLGGVGAPSMAALNRIGMQLYSVSLTRIEKKPDDRDVDTEEQALAALEGQRRGPGGPGGSGAPPKVEVKIDWDGLSSRFRQLTRVSGLVMSVVPSPDSRTYAFVALGGGSEEGGGGPALYTIGEDGSRMTRLSSGPAPGPGGGRGRGGFGGGFGDPQWARDSRSLYYMQGGGIYTVAVPAPPAGESGASPAAGGGGRGGRGFGGGAPVAAAATGSTPSPRRITFTVRVEVDEAAERKQVFGEAWRIMKDRFYDPKMHGANWAAAKDTYEPLLGNIADSDELRTLVMQMIGELNASHTGVTGAEAPGERIATRFPGFELEPDASGYYKVSSILRKGPADHEYVTLQTGQYILSVDGKELKTSDNYWKLFNILPGRKFEFKVNSKPSMDGAWAVTIEPLTATALGNLEYDAWVKTRRDMVGKLSNGEIGYLHIRAMNAASLQQFERDLLENQTRKALIIDQRFNGGGGIDQELLEILQQRRYQSYRGRDSIDMPRPVRAFFGPMVVMQNERSASNAEMFPEGFRALGLGKVVGVPTYGAVIGTGAYRLMDGSTIRTPSYGVYNAKGENFENWGVPPDVLVDNTPDDFLAGRDRQVERAVEVLREQLK